MEMVCVSPLLIDVTKYRRNQDAKSHLLRVLCNVKKSVSSLSPSKDVILFVIILSRIILLVLVHELIDGLVVYIISSTYHPNSQISKNLCSSLTMGQGFVSQIAINLRWTLKLCLLLHLSMYTLVILLLSVFTSQRKIVSFSSQNFYSIIHEMFSNFKQALISTSLTYISREKGHANVKLLTRLTITSQHALFSS